VRFDRITAKLMDRIIIIDIASEKDRGRANEPPFIFLKPPSQVGGSCSQIA